MKTAKVYYLWGPESYLINERIAEIIAELWSDTGEEPEVVLVDADEMAALDLGQTLEYSPLFALSRVVIIKNPGWLGKMGRKTKKNETSLQVLQDYFQHDYRGQVLIITSTERTAANPITKFLDKNARVENIKTLNSKDLEKWCQVELEQRQLRMAPSALNKIVNSSQDMYYLINFFDKLALMELGSEITAAQIEEHLDSRQEITVFKLTDALLARNIKGALAAFYKLQEQGLHHLLLLNLITGQFLSLAKVKSYHELGYSRSMIAEATGMKDYTIRKMMDKESRFSYSDIRGIFEKLLAADTSFKSESKDPRILMESLLIEIAG